MLFSPLNPSGCRRIWDSSAKLYLCHLKPPCFQLHQSETQQDSSDREEVAIDVPSESRVWPVPLERSGGLGLGDVETHGSCWDPSSTRTPPGGDGAGWQPSVQAVVINNKCCFWWEVALVPVGSSAAFFQFFGKLHRWQSTAGLVFSMCLQDTAIFSLPTSTLSLPSRHGEKKFIDPVKEIHDAAAGSSLRAVLIEKVSSKAFPG